MKYLADDGKVFDTREGCIAYEKKCKEEEEEARRYVEMKDKRRKEVEAAFESYNNLLQAFVADYPEEQSMKKLCRNVESVDPLFRFLFD